MEMIGALQDDIQFRRKHSAFLTAADSTLDYIQKRYQGAANSSGEQFDTWFSSQSAREAPELIHLRRARGHNIHSGYIPMGATRSATVFIGARVVSEEQAREEQAAKSSCSDGEKPIDSDPGVEISQPATSPVETNDRWLLDEERYMVYRNRDNRNLIPIIRSRYPAIYYGSKSENRTDVLSLSMAYLTKIKNIMDDCQRKWPWV